MGFTLEQMNQVVKQQLSSGGIIDYAIGDRPYTATCDYMAKCAYQCKPTKDISEEDVRLDTFSEAFIMMNTDKIIYKIKTLMKERFFYFKKDLISHINIQKEYPLVQINAALNQLVEDKNEYITDKYGRLGNLINIETMYLFQPLELKDTHISTYDRSVPLDYKRESISIDLPSKITDVVIQSDIQDGDEKNISILLQKIENDWNDATTNIKKIPRGNKSWYKFCNLVIQQLEKEGYSSELVLDILRDHIVEELEFIEQFKLLNYSETHAENELVVKLKQYFINNEITAKGRRGIILQNNGLLQLLIFKEEQNIWKLGEGEDYVDFEEEIAKIKDRLLPAKVKMNSLVGFMIPFKKEYMIFKVKDLTKPRHKGTRIDQAGKNITVKVLNNILGKQEYTTSSDINQKQMSIMIEFYLRLNESQKKSNKVWFITSSEAILVNIEKL